jgi:cell division protein FtsW
MGLCLHILKQTFMFKKQRRSISRKNKLYQWFLFRRSKKNKPFKNAKADGQIDKTLLVLTVAFVLAGLVAIADASAPAALRVYGDQYHYLKQQLFWAFVGILLMFITSKINYRLWQHLAKYAIFVVIILLIAVLIPGIGMKVAGARRWLDLGFISFQPTELVKLLVCIYFAKLATSNKKMAAFFIPLAAISALVMLQPDLGTTLVIAVIGISQIFVSGISISGLFAAIGSGAVLSLILIFTSEYRRDRLLTFFEQTQDPLGKAYHIRQVLYALGSGGLFGVGLGQSRQKHLFLPETATDSIFAVIAEEIGFVGSAMIIVVFLYFILRLIKISLTCPDTFSRVFVVGMAAWLGGQAFLNIGSMVALVPLTGLPLPFFSYGGTSLVSMLAGIGIVLNISKYAK